MDQLNNYLYISAILFSLGTFAVMTRRNGIAVLMGVELILNAANLNFVVTSYYQLQTQCRCPHYLSILMSISISIRLSIYISSSCSISFHTECQHLRSYSFYTSICKSTSYSLYQCLSFRNGPRRVPPGGAG